MPRIEDLVPGETRVHYSEDEIQLDGLVLEVVPDAGLVRVRFDGYSPSDEVSVKRLTVIA